MLDHPLNSLLKALGGIDNLLILPHNYPDPDAVASAVALHYLLANKLNIQADLAYHGIMGRAENKALANFLGHPMQPLTRLDQSKLWPIALVDTQPGAGNNTLPPKANVIIVIDHHPLRQDTARSRFSDVRPEIGATSTILTEYLQAAALEPDQRIATALFCGIKTDTLCLSRHTSPADVAAYTYLQSRLDVEALVEIERAQVPVDYFKSFDATLRAARLYDQVTISYIGPMDYPDLAAEMADMLLRLEGSQWVICMGVYQDELVVSVRTRNPEGGAGRLAQAIVGNQGTAGGHDAMGAGHIPLKSKNPRNLATRLHQSVFKHLKLPSDIKGKRLV